MLVGFNSGRNQDVVKLPESVNTTAFDEIAFLADSKGEQFYFTRTGSPAMNRRLYENGIDIGSESSDMDFTTHLKRVYSEIAGHPVSNPIQSAFNQDIYFANLNNGEWSVEQPDYPINNALPNSAVGILESPKGLFVLNHFYESGSMYKGISTIQFGGDGGASFPKPIFVKGLNNKGTEMNAYVTPDGEIAILSMRRTGGDSDLFVSFFTGIEGEWTMPKNLGIEINTRARESTPFLSHNKRKLYFASDREGGVGGSDIYMADRLNYSYNKWSTPVLMNSHINTPNDESHPCYVSATDDFYFSSNRDGSFDIFKYKSVERKKTREITIIGRIINKETGVVTGADLFFGPEQFADYLEYYSTFNGRFKIVITTGEILKFQARKAGFETRIKRFDFDEMVDEDKDTYELDLFLYPKKTIDKPGSAKASDKKIFNMTVDEIKQQKTISVHQIQFVRSKATVLSSSRPALDDLNRLLQENSEISILITGHTDNQGARDLLMKLSEERAQAIKNHLVSLGTHANRIRCKGYGPDRALNANETERDKSLNRRVEITILD
jgi:outer membrane protein OmpA-like peptidoglycan-associated protein